VRQAGGDAKSLTALEGANVSRIYAGILGPLAMTVAICRGWLASGGVEGTLSSAVLYLLMFAILGAILGHVAQATIDESVRTRLEQQLAQLAAQGGNKEAAV
jgi:hypothetical protein